MVKRTEYIVIKLINYLQDCTYKYFRKSLQSQTFLHFGYRYKNTSFMKLQNI